MSVRAVDTGTAYNERYYGSYRVDGATTAYSRENPHWLGFFGHVADVIVDRLKPQTALDVGCAKGFLVECLRDRGVEAFGLDVSAYAISQVRPDIKHYCWVGSAGEAINSFYNLITCIEVCEHLPQAESEEAVRQMASHADAVLFSSTPGHFDDPTHVNVHPIIDWLRLFARFSFAPDEGFDASFVAPQAMLFRRVARVPTDQALCKLAYERNRAIFAAELKNSPEMRGELDAILNSRGWKVLSLYRRARFRVKHPVAQGLRKIGLM